MGKLDFSTPAIQDYLKTIFDLTEGHNVASTTALAERLGITPASVTGMLQHLASAGTPLVAYEKYRGVSLTSAGELAALDIIRRHRLIETFLVKTLGYRWDEVHEEADRLEHVISEDLEARIARALGDPEHDPHGEFIPTAALTMPIDKSIPLSDLRPNQKAVIRYIRDADSALLRHLESLGLIPGVNIKALDFSPFDNNLRLHVGRQAGDVTVGEGITRQVFIDIL